MRITITTVPTYTATIYVGLKERASGLCTPAEEARAVIQSYVNEVGLCVTVTETEYVYTDGREHGLIVGFINYPRFPSEPRNIEDRAMELAERLLVACRQLKVSVIFPDRTVMLNAPVPDAAMEQRRC